VEQGGRRAQRARGVGCARCGGAHVEAAVGAKQGFICFTMIGARTDPGDEKGRSWWTLLRLYAGTTMQMGAKKARPDLAARPCRYYLW